MSTFFIGSALSLSAFPALLSRQSYRADHRPRSRKRRSVSSINEVAREMTCKIVYCGPALSGKTANLQALHHHTAAHQRSALLVAGEHGGPGFDFLQLEVGVARGLTLSLQLYALSERYPTFLQPVFRQLDGLVFVADSHPERAAANREALASAITQLQKHGYRWEHLPCVLQLNQRDLPNAIASEVLIADLARPGQPVVPAVATQGIGVFETLREIARLVLPQATHSG